MAPIERFSASLARERARRAAEYLARDRRIRLVFLFGSAADEQRAEVRDVDVAFLARPALSFEERLKLQGDVSTAAGGDVDLVPIDGAPISLCYEIADAGRCLFSREPGEEVEFVTRARARYWDFRPYLEEQSRLAAERQRERLSGSQS